MTPVVAAKYLMELSRTDEYARRAVLQIVQHSDQPDLPEWVTANPDDAIALAEQFKDVFGQFDKFEDMLSKGDIS